MSTTVQWNGIGYRIPAVGDSSWGEYTSLYLTSLGQNALSRYGGIFELANDVNFGPTKGLVSQYFTSRNAVGSLQVASTGSDLVSPNRLRLGVIPNATPASAVYDAVAWRNNANSADLRLLPKAGTESLLQYNSVDLVNVSAAQTLTNKSMDGNQNTFTNIPGSAFTDVYIKANGTQPLTANWAAGAFAATFNSVQVGSAANTISALSTIINTGTLTLPTATDTLVGRATADTLSNKTLTNPVINTKARFTPNTTVGTTSGDVRVNSSLNNKLVIYNGTAEVPVSPLISAKEYGVTGNGSTDDTTAIQTAITAIGSLGGGTLYFPKGTYIMSSTVTLVDNIRILGESKDTTIFSCSGHSIGNTNGYPYFTAVNKSNVIFDNIQINGNGSWTSTPFSNPYGSGNSVGFNNANTGIFIYPTSSGKSGVQISNCDIRGLEFGAVIGQGFSPNGNIIDKVIVRDSHFYNIGWIATYFYGVNNFLYQQNIVETVQGNMTSPGVTSTSESKFGDGLHIQQSTNGIIDDNVITDLQDSGVILEDGLGKNSNIIISNNMFHDFQANRGDEQQSAIYIGDGGTNDPVVCTGNVINTIPGRGITAESCNIIGGSIYNCDVGIIPAPNKTLLVDGVDIRNCRLGIYLLDSDTVAGNPVSVRNCTILNNTQCGIYIASDTKYEIANNLIQDNGTGVDPSTHSGAFVDQWAANNSGITAVFTNDDCLIRDNVFVSTASAGDTTGQLTAISVFSSGNTQAQNVLNNLFIFTGTLASYPSNLQVTPCAFQTWFFNGTDYTRTSYELFSNGNRSTKTGFTNTSTIEGAAGFPRLVGYASAAPGSGAHLQGDFYLNSAVSSGGPYLFMCTTTGTPGTWESWGGTNVSLAAVGSSPNANAASLSGQTLNLQPASASFPGVVTTGTQSFAGDKTFTTVVAVNGNTITLDADGTGAQNTAILQGTSTNRFGLSANSSQGNGGELYLFGPNHATDSQTIKFANNGTFTGVVDINGKWTLGASGGSQTHVLNGSASATGSYTGTAFISSGTNAASAGVARLANAENISWRNAGNSANLSLTVNSSNALQFNSITLVDLSSTQTLTNKTLSGNTAVTLISGSGTLTLNTSGTITLPNATDTLVGKATTDTLTNKTLTSPTISGGTHTSLTGFSLRDTSAAFDVTVAAVSSTTLTSGRTLTIDTNNVSTTLKMGANLTVTAAATVSNTNTGDITLATVGSAPAAEGASLSGQVLTLQPANASFGGVVSNTTQTLAGAKTFANDVAINTNNLTLDADATGTQLTVIKTGANTNQLYLTANTAAGGGGEITMYGGSHGTKPNTKQFATAGNFVGTISGTNGDWEIGRSSSTTIRFNCATATSATAGANGAVPSQVALYATFNVNGTVYKVPLFNT